MANQKWNTRVKKFFQGEAENNCKVHPDVIICHRDGSVTVKKGYFYRSGQSEFSWAKEVVADLEANDFDPRVISKTDNMQTWPRDSYFEVRIQNRFRVVQ